MLPTEFSSEIYWSDIYQKPLDFWLPVVDTLSRKNGLGDGWERACLGRNVVLLNANYALKLGPPCWPGDMDSEAIVLPWIAGKLAVETPEMLGSGSIEGWNYIIQRRLSGQNLYELWTTLTKEQRVDLAFQHGEILQALHNLPCDTLAGSAVEFDWTNMYAEQMKVCRKEMAGRGIHPGLVEDAERYLDDAAPLLGDDGKRVLLHGDLTHLNLLVRESGKGWQ
ncbi:MAG: phosphotransferase, partial [Anaerolineaceae bacterium]|nr:phosphotransferase [Anaerolineaceae bacterium]